MKYIFILLVFELLSVNCRTPQVFSGGIEVLKNHRRVAVTEMTVSLETETGFTRDVLDFVSALFKNQKPNEEEFRETLSSLAIETTNKQFLAHGFMPLERIRIKKILDEIKLHNLGLLESRKEGEFGKLSGAEAIFIGKLNIRVDKGIPGPTFLNYIIPIVRFGDRVLLNFYGKLVSIETGSILISGTIHSENTELKISDISKIIDEYFRDVESIR